MEKKFFREVIIVLLPPLFNQPELDSNDSAFLDLGDIINSNFSSVGLDEKMRENPTTFVNKIAKVDLSKEVTNLIELRSKELVFMRLINYPMNKSQLENLKKAFNISWLIVVSLASFDVLTTAKEKNFLCPLCFKSYSRETSSVQGRYLCSLDKKDFSISYVDKFTDCLTTYYLQNSIEVIQYFKDDDKQKERKILNLSIDLNDFLQGNIKKKIKKMLNDLLSIARNE